MRPHLGKMVVAGYPACLPGREDRLDSLLPPEEILKPATTD